MENVVYIIGAGFSRPLGLPVVSDFISKAKDIYHNNKQEYSHFQKVFWDIDHKLATIALKYNSDLDNIEEVLSILEMERIAGDISNEEAQDFNKFIIDVIYFFTPKIENNLNTFISLAKPNISGRDLESIMFELNSELSHVQQDYGNFVLKLFNTDASVRALRGNGEWEEDIDNNGIYQKLGVFLEQQENIRYKYSVISLNYDMVLEDIAAYYSEISGGNKIQFTRPHKDMDYNSPILVKLHGSIDNKMIIPPTWNKSIHEHINLEWKVAHNILSKANHIRFIGYSLPEADAYIKYLLKSSAIHSEHLKTIDVLCLDPSGDVKSKFERFIAQSYKSKFRFVNANVTSYLHAINRRSSDSIEEGHYAVFQPQNTNNIG